MARQEIEMVFPEETLPATLTQGPNAEALTVPARARIIEVRNQAGLLLANDFLKDLKRLGAKIDETFDPQIQKAHALHKSLLTEKKRLKDPLEVAERIVKPKIAAYIEEEDRKRQEAERVRWKAEEEARRIADQALDKASALDEKGDKGKADEIIVKGHAKALEVLEKAPEVPEAPRAEGLSIREVWQFEIVNEAAIPREYLTPDTVKIGRIVRALKHQANIPGVRTWSEKTVATRAGLQD